MASALATPPLDDLARRAKGRAKPVICQLVHTLNVGGAEILARQFAERAREEFDFVFACLDSTGLMADELRDAGYVVEALDRRPGFDLQCVRRLARFCQRYQVGVIHAHQYAPFFYAALARVAAWRDLPILFTEHGRDYPDFRRSKRVLANRLLLGRRDRVVGVGQCVRQALIDYEGLPPERVEVIYNGIDVEHYASAAGERQRVRTALGLCDDDVAIIQVARLNRLKDHATAIRAMRLLVDDCPRAQLFLAGDGEEQTAIDSLIRQFGLGRHIHMLGTRRDISSLLSAADVFLLTSVSEGIPLTLIEAMAAGLPCVTTAVGGMPEVIVPGETGWLTQPGNSLEIKSRLHELATAPALRRAFGEAGRKRCERTFDHMQMHNSYRSAYRRLTMEAAR